MGQFVTLSGVLEKATEKAVCFRTEERGEIWIPRSALADEMLVDIGDTEVEVARWFADKNNLA